MPKQVRSLTWNDDFQILVNYSVIGFNLFGFRFFIFWGGGGGIYWLLYSISRI